MKKLFTKLLILTLGATSLSGCDLFTGDVNQKNEENIELRDYTKSVVMDSSYTFDGKVFLLYEDDSEKEVTKDCVFDYSTLDLSKVGKNSYFTVKYEGEQYIFTKKAYIEVTKKVTLTDIQITSYSTFCKLGSTYTFDGVVTASYDDGTKKNVTTKATVNASQVNTSIKGNYTVKVSYTEGSVTFTKSFSLKVAENQGTLYRINASNYTSEVDKGETYTFDGVVTATYRDGTEYSSEIVTDKCSFGTISTSTSGNKSLNISYTDTVDNITKSTAITIEVIARVTGISISPTLEIGLNKAKTLSPTVLPSDAKNKNLNFVSADPSIATVDSNGKVVGKTANASTVITITSQENNSIKATVNVNVVEVAQDEWTILMYVCGADLESSYASSNEGLATMDLKEIASVSGQPDDVNVVVQAGGSNSWSSTYSSVISTSKTNRFHLQNKTYVKDSQSTKVNMGLESSLEDFITWGLQTYPADKIGLIFWNHGGGMTGCCFDEQYSNDGLTPSEFSSAIKSAKSAVGYDDKFEFIGYDCCLMQVQDIAGLNAEYAKYQIASEESEWGYGWTYDSWIDDLFAKKTTAEILKACVDGYKSETENSYGTNSSSNDQTLSVIDLSYWDEYEVAWEDMATTLTSVIDSSSKWSTFEDLLNTCQRYGGQQSYYGMVYAFDVFDVGDFFNKMEASSNYSNNSTLMSNISTLQSIYTDLINYEWHGRGAGNSTGLTLFAPVSGYSSKGDYSTSSTPFSVWRSLCINRGSWYSY